MTINLQAHIDKEDILVIDLELPQRRLKGLYSNNTILMNTSIANDTEYKCVLAEELGHYYTSNGNILDYQTTESQRQEDRAHRWAFETILPIENFIDAFEHGCRNKYETASFLEVTENFLEKAVEHYKLKYGTYATFEDYIVYLEPLGVMKKY